MDKLLKKYIKNEKNRKIAENIITIVLCLIIFFGIRNFVAMPVQADGVSMYPTIDDNNVLLVNRLSYLFGKPDYNDIVVFPYDEDELYIKRIIGLPGDEINLENGYLYINDVLYKDEFSEVLSAYGDREYPITLEEDTYYVMGDNRKVSKDSRYSSVGDISKDNIMGKAFMIYFPFDSFTFLK